MRWLNPIELIKALGHILALLLSLSAYGMIFILGVIELLVIVVFHGPLASFGVLTLDYVLEEMDEVLDRIRW